MFKQRNALFSDDIIVLNLELINQGRSHNLSVNDFAVAFLLLEKNKDII